MNAFLFCNKKGDKMKILIASFVLIIFFNGCSSYAPLPRNCNTPQPFVEIKSNSKIQTKYLSLTSPSDNEDAKWQFVEKNTIVVLTKRGKNYTEQIQILPSYNEMLLKEEEIPRSFPLKNCKIDVNRDLGSYGRRLSEAEITHIDFANIKGLKCFISYKLYSYYEGFFISFPAGFLGYVTRLVCNYYKNNGELDKVLINKYLQTDIPRSLFDKFEQHEKNMNDIINNIELKDIDLEKTKKLK